MPQGRVPPAAGSAPALPLRRSPLGRAGPGAAAPGASAPWRRERAGASCAPEPPAAAAAAAWSGSRGSWPPQVSAGSSVRDRDPATREGGRGRGEWRGPGGRHRAVSASLGRARRPRGAQLGAATCGGRGSGLPAAPGAPRLRPGRTDGDGGRGPVFPGGCASPPCRGGVLARVPVPASRGGGLGGAPGRAVPSSARSGAPSRPSGVRGAAQRRAGSGSGCVPRAETKAAGSSRAPSDARAFPFAGNDSRGTKGPTPAAAPREPRAKLGKRFTLRAALRGSAPRRSAGEGRLRACTCGAFWRRLGLVPVCGRSLRGREAAVRDGRISAAPSPPAGAFGGDDALSPVLGADARSVPSAVLVGCCARLCPALGSGMGSTRGTAVPCAHPGEGCRTGTVPRMGFLPAGWARVLVLCRSAPAPLSIPLPLPADPQHGAGWLQTEAELFPFPGTPPGTAEPSGTSSSPGEARTVPAVRDGVSTAAQPSSSAGTTDAAAGREGTSPTPPGGSPARVLTAVTMELSTAPAISTAPKTEPIGNEKAESSPTPQRTLSHSSSHMMVPSSSRGQWGTPSTMRTVLTQSWEGSLSPSHPALEPEGRGATIPPSDIKAGTPQGLTTDSPVPGTSGTLSFVGGLQSLQSPPGELGKIHQVLAGTGPAGVSHSLQGTTVAWLGPHATSRPPLLFPGVADRGGLTKGPGASTALLPMESRLPPDPSTTAAVPGVTFPGPEGAPDLTMEVLGLLNTQSPPGPNRVIMNQTWHISALPGEAPLSLGPQPSLGLIPTADTHPAASPGREHAERPQVPGGTLVWAGDAEPWAVTAPPSTALPTAPSSPLQPALTKPTSSPPLLTFSTSITSTATSTPTATSTATATSPALLRDERTAPLDPISAACQGAVEELTRGPSAVPGSPHQPTDPPGGTEPPPSQSSPTERPHADPTCVTPNPETAGRATPEFIVEDEPPQLRGGLRGDPPGSRRHGERWRCRALSVPAASLLRVPCELALDMAFVPALRDPASHEHHVLLSGLNRTVSVGPPRGEEHRAGAVPHWHPWLPRRWRPGWRRCAASCVSR